MISIASKMRFTQIHIFLLATIAMNCVSIDLNLAATSFPGGVYTAVHSACYKTLSGLAGHTDQDWAAASGTDSWAPKADWLIASEIMEATSQLPERLEGILAVNSVVDAETSASNLVFSNDAKDPKHSKLRQINFRISEILRRLNSDTHIRYAGYSDPWVIQTVLKMLLDSSRQENKAVWKSAKHDLLTEHASPTEQPQSEGILRSPFFNLTMFFGLAATSLQSAHEVPAFSLACGIGSCIFGFLALHKLKAGGSLVHQKRIASRWPEFAKENLLPFEDFVHDALEATSSKPLPNRLIYLGSDSAHDDSSLDIFLQTNSKGEAFLGVVFD